MNRAYSTLNIKKFDVTGRKFSGMATTPRPDRVDDIVEPLGVEFQNPMPMMLFHDSTMPVGQVRFGRVTPDGIPFDAEIPEVVEEGEVKTLTDKAAHFLKYGLINKVSIGFRPIGDAIERLKSGGVRFLKTEVMELSLVTIPANPDAAILAMKSLDEHLLALRGTPEVSVPPVTPPAAVGRAAVQVRKGTSTMAKKTYLEQIKDFENTRAAKQARREEIQTKAADEGRGKEADEKEEFDTLTLDIKSIDSELVDLREMEKSALVTAAPVIAATAADAQRSREGTSSVQVTQSLPPGIGMARYVMAQIHARKEQMSVRDVVKERWPSDQRLYAFVTKAAVPAATTTDATWAGPLVDQTNLASEFIAYLRPRTIIGRIPGLRNVPFNIKVAGQSTGAVAGWVKQGKAKPVTSFSTFSTTLLRTKIAAIAVITQELALDSSPSAETLVRDELARAVIERMDIDFIDPALAAVAGENPASITNGVTPLTSAGVTEAFARADMVTILSQFVENNVDPTQLVLIMPNSLAMALSLMVNSLGQASFPGVSPLGGTLLGIPVVASQYAANASGSGNLVIAANAGDIFLADDGKVTIDASREASIEMSDAPAADSSVPTAGTSYVSMYQTNSIAIKAERFINWAKARSTAVVFMDDVNWGSVGSP